MNFKLLVYSVLISTCIFNMRAGEPSAEPKIKVEWKPDLAKGFLYCSIQNTGSSAIKVAPDLTIIVVATSPDAIPFDPISTSDAIYPFIQVMPTDGQKKSLGEFITDGNPLFPPAFIEIKPGETQSIKYSVNKQDMLNTIDKVQECEFILKFNGKEIEKYAAKKLGEIWK